MRKGTRTKAKERRGEGVDWLRGRMRWEDRLQQLRRDACVPMPGPAAGGFVIPLPPREPVRTTR